MSRLLGLGQPVGRRGLSVSEDGAFRGEAEGIIWSIPPLPRLAALHQGHNEESALREEGQNCRTQSTDGLSGSRGRGKPPEKLTAAHSGSRALRIAEDGAVAAYYQPGASKELPEMEGAA